MSSLVLFGRNSSAILKPVCSQLTLLDRLTGPVPTAGFFAGAWERGVILSQAGGAGDAGDTGCVCGGSSQGAEHGQGVRAWPAAVSML